MHMLNICNKINQLLFCVDVMKLIPDNIEYLIHLKKKKDP